MKNIEKFLIAILLLVLVLKNINTTNKVEALKRNITSLTETINKQDSINERLKEGIMFSIQLSNYHTDDINNLENLIIKQ